MNMQFFNTTSKGFHYKIFMCGLDAGAQDESTDEDTDHMWGREGLKGKDAFHSLRTVWSGAIQCI